MKTRWANVYYWIFEHVFENIDAEFDFSTLSLLDTNIFRRISTNKTSNIFILH